MNPLLWIVGARSREADRQPHDPGPIRQKQKTMGGTPEAFARHLRARGRRIAIELTTIPPEWMPAPELEGKLTHGTVNAHPLPWSHQFRKWKHELKVGKNRE